MSVGNVFYETTSFSPAIPTLPQFRNRIESRAGVRSFTKVMNPQLIQKASDPRPEGRGMIWKGLRTPPKCNFELTGPKGPGFPFLDEELSVLLKGLGSRETTRTSKSSCLYGWISGVVASFLLENPLLLFIGLGECFPRSYAQQKVGSEFQVNTDTSNDQDSPSVASFSNGNFVVAWETIIWDGSLMTVVYGQLFDDNRSKIGSEFRVGSFRSTQLNPSVASFSNDNFVVTWTSFPGDGSGYGVNGQLFDGNGSRLGSQFRANSYIFDDQLYPSVASFSDGNFVVTWQSGDQDGSGSGIYGQLFDGNGSMIGSEFQANSYTMRDQLYPSVASFSNGNFVVAWESNGQDGSGYGVYSQLFDGNGSKIGSEFRANTYTTSHQQNPSVASFSNDNFVVTWESWLQDGSSYGVYGQLFDGNGSKIGSEFQANSYTTLGQQDPSVANLADGNFVVTWESDGQDGSNFGVNGQLFNGNGSKIGSEFRTNSYIPGNQQYPSVASFSNGNFVVTWQSMSQDGSLWGVYGQIFNDNITYPSSPVTTSFSTTSTTTTSSKTSSVSSSTLSAIGRTRTSVNPSSSRTTVPSTTRPITTSNNRTTLSATSDPSNRFSWIWFLLGGVGAISCLGLTGYFIFKSKDRKKDGDVHASELREREQTDDSIAKTQYQYTPNVVIPEDGYEYQYTPDVVIPEDGYEYQYTPDVVIPEDD